MSEEAPFSTTLASSQHRHGPGAASVVFKFPGSTVLQEKPIGFLLTASLGISV